MKKLLAMVMCLGLMVFGFAAGAKADLVTFNFDPAAGLPNNSDATAIGNYMTGVYGSTVTVTGNSPSSETGNFTLLGGIGDGYIESEPFKEHLIQINFTVPITSASFDYGQLVDEFHADYFDGTTWTNFFNQSYVGVEIGNSGTISFPVNVTITALRFHDDYVGEVGIDNLVVNKQAVPEAATMMMLGTGLLGLLGFRRRIKK